MGHTSWPIAGREEVLDLIHSRVTKGTWPGLLLSGPEGVGRTTIVKRVFARIQRSFAPRMVHATQSAASVPYGSVQDVLAQPGDGLFPRTVGKLVQEAEKQRARRPVLIVDDAHLLDPSSAALVLHLATASPVFVLLTIRSDLPAPDAISKLSKDKLLETVELGPLTRDQVAEVVSGALDGQVDGGTLHRLWRLSAGSPRVLERLVTGALREGALIEDRGVWRMNGARPTGRWLPDTDQQRLSQLSPEVREAATLLAFVGLLSASNLERMSSPAALEAVEREGLIEHLPDSGHPYRRQPLRLRQRLYAEVLRAETGPLTARRVYRALADVLESRGARRRCDRMRLALWRQESGGATDPAVFLAGAEEANTLFNPQLAERLARAALEAGGGFEARRLMAEAIRWQGRVEEVDAQYELLEAEASGDDEWTKAALGRAINLFFGLARAKEAEAVLERADERIQDPFRKDELAVTRATIALSQGRVDAALEAVTRVFERLDEVTITSLSASATVALPAIVWAGRAEEAAAFATGALAMPPTSTEDLAILRDDLLLSLCFADGFAGRLEDAAALAASRYEAALDAQADELRGEWALAAGHVSLVRGHVRAAAHRLREAASLLQKHVLGAYGAAWCLGCLAEAAALAGDVGAAGAALEQAEAAIPGHILVPNRELGRIWVAASRNDLATARLLALDLATTAETGGAWLLAAIALHDAVRLGAPAGEVEERLSTVAANVQGAFGAAFSGHVTALAADDGNLLRDASMTFAGLGASLLAAEAAAAAADAYRRAGKEGSARAQEIRSAELQQACEGAHTPALGRLARLTLMREAPLLTQAEAEVAKLVGEGLSNTQIAALLDVPYKTVCSRLGRIYSKLPSLEHRRDALRRWCHKVWTAEAARTGRRPPA